MVSDNGEREEPQSDNSCDVLLCVCNGQGVI